MKIEQFLALFEKPKKIGSGWMVCCPAHDDHSPSLSVSEKGGKTVLHCFAGCTTESIVEAMGLRMADLFTDTEGKRTPANRAKPQIVAVYQYVDESGRVLYENVRFEPKDFKARRPDGNGGHIWKLNGVGRVPYRLPEIMAAIEAGAKRIYLCEGEKDVDNVLSLGLPATNLKNWQREFNQYIKAAQIVIIRDHDRPGVRLANDAAAILSADISTIKIVDLFDSDPMPDDDGSDVSDWIKAEQAAGNNADAIAEKLVEIAENANEWASADGGKVEDRNRPGPLPLVRLSDVEAKEVEWLWRPMIPTCGYTLVEGVEGIGKTFLMLNLAASITLGRPLPGSNEATEPGEVLLLSAEDSAAYVLKPRLEAMGAACDKIFALDGNFTLDDEGFGRLAWTLSEHNIKFVLIDPLFSFTGGVDLNKDNQIRTVTDRLNRFAEDFKCGIGGVRHLNKTKGYGDPRNAGLNGVAWRAAARSALIVGHDPADKAKRAIALAKSNLTAETSKSFGYAIDADGAFTWTGVDDLTIETMLAYNANDSIEDRGAKTDAMAFLRTQLESGSRKSVDIYAEAKAAGISEATLRRAKDALKIKATKGEFAGHWLWKMPKDEDAQHVEDVHEGSHIKTNEHLRVNEAVKPSYGNNLAEDAQSFVSERLREHLGTAGGREYLKCDCGHHAFVGRNCPHCGGRA